jgi:hypothetical protein
MNLTQLDKSYQDFKNEHTYQYLKYVAEKLKSITLFSKEHNQKEFENYEYHFNHVMINIVDENVAGKKTPGLNFKFFFSDKEDTKYVYSFTTYHKQAKTFNVDINEKLLSEIDDIYQFFHDEKRNDIYLLLVEHLRENLINDKRKMVIFNVNHDVNEPFQLLLGKECSSRYEKEQLEKTVQPITIKNTRLKV